MKVDIAIITIRQDECRAILDRFKSFTPYHHRRGRTYWICNVKTKYEHQCVVAITRTSGPGNDVSQKLANDIISDLNPDLILVVGIAGGVPDNDFTLGDVVISSRIYNFNAGASHENDSSTYDIKGDIHPLVSKLSSDLPFYEDELKGWNTEESIGMSRPSINLQRQKIYGDDEWRTKIQSTLSSHFDEEKGQTRLPLFIVGPIASSNHLIRSPSELKRWQFAARKVLAVEMEAAGVFIAAQGIRREHPVLAIRGISDIVGLERDPNWTKYACHTAAAFTYAFVTTVPIKPQKKPELLQRSKPKIITKQPHQDWSEVPEVGIFFGRTKELATLEQWILEDHCKLVAIIGMRGIGKTKLSAKLGKGGIGKTDLSLKLAQGIQDQFEYVIWKRLLNAPKVTSILADLIKFLSNQQEIELPDSINEQISRLLFYLQQHRCLLIFDNAETILEGGNHIGQYREGYEEFGQLFTQICEVSHQSCLLLTSREKPPEIALFEGPSRPVRSLELEGLDHENSKQIFATFGEFQGSEEDWQELARFYNGNPLALELAAKHIQKVYSSDISAFLRQSGQIFSDLRDLLDWYFDRLDSFEKEIMYWLAINREPMSLAELKDDVISLTAKTRLSSTLDLLQRFVPLEKSNSRFTLQPVLIEYMTGQLIEHVILEIEYGSIDLLNKHALLKALAKDYVRESQIRLILQPVIQSFLSRFGKADFEKKLKHLLILLHQNQLKESGYSAGNILNFLIHVDADLRGADFSHLPVYQAYLRETSLIDVNFSHADLSKSVFTDIFGSILSVAFSPDGTKIAAGTDSGDVRIWQVSDGNPLLTFSGHTDWIWGLAFSPDGKILASGSSDQTVRLWDIASGQCIHALRGHTHRIRSVAFSKAGSHLASASEDATIRIWDVESGQLLHILEGHTNPVRAVVFTPDGKTLVSGSDDQTVRVWDIEGEESPKIFRGHKSQIWSLALSRDGKVIASGSDDRTIRTWDITTGECLKVLQGHTNWICSLSFAPDDTTLASGSADGTIRIWNITTGQPLNTLLGHKNWVNSVNFSADGKALASGSHDQTVRLWEISTGHCLMTLQGYSSWVRSVSFSPKDKLIATGDRAVRLWNSDNGQLVMTLQGHTAWIRALAFNFDGSLLASGSDDQTVRVWKMQTLQPLYTLQGHTNRVKSIAFSPDGTMLISGSDDHSVRLWDMRIGRHIKILRGHTNRVRSVAFSPKGFVFASGSDDRTARLWNTQADQSISTLEGHTNRVWSVAFSPDGQLLATGSEDSTIRLWDVSTGQCLKILQGHANSIWSITFSPDGSMLASSSEDLSVRVWKVESGQCLYILKGHTNPIWTITFSFDSMILASGSHDHTVRLWDHHSGKNLAILQGHTDAIWALAFSPDGSTLASCSDDGTCRLWKIPVGESRLTLKSERPYERMNITQIKGLTEAQKMSLRALGAIEE